MKNYAIDILKVILFIFCTSILYACSTHKDTGGSRAIQNLTSRYNYIYNANVILTTHQQELRDTYADNYEEILPVYTNPEKYDIYNLQADAGLPAMDDVIKKAQVIILEKSYGNYIDEAYLLLGKANFFKKNYFNAVEYFGYVTKNYDSLRNSYLQGMDWKARSLMQLGKYSEAAGVLDTLQDSVNVATRHIAEPLATIAQMYIYQHNYKEAINTLQAAIASGSEQQEKIRWTYILAQLSEIEQQYTTALQHYRRVEKSNAPFELYFNANLNRIKLNAFLSGEKVNKQAQLLALLKDDKNLDYHDQVYYQIAESYARDEQFNDALKYYNLSVRNSTSNNYQKGLSYLKVADLHFKELRNYREAKLYYDSAVLTLPKTYPGYGLIVKKNQNLEYLTDRYEIISVQDTLQALARLPEAERLTKIDAMLNPKVNSPSIPDQNINTPLFDTNTSPSSRTGNTSGAFYFANTSAVDMGFSDFKKKWGNRKLEDNWRQSIRTSAQATTDEIKKNESGNAGINPDSVLAGITDKDQKIRNFKDSIPLTPVQLAKSNQQIIDAYYQIANFYLQELNDYKEAETVYQLLLERFPDNNHLAAIYYSMFLLNKTSNPEKSDLYRNKVLKEFPTSTYSKTILDPSFSLRQSELETAINAQYNTIFDQYEQKDFSGVMQRVDEVLNRNPENYLAPQLAYLKSIAIGRTSHVDSLINSFELLKSRFPNDQLIVPLVNDHLTYIRQHLEEFRKRPVALIDFDPSEPRFFKQQPLASVSQKPQTQTPPVVTPKPIAPDATAVAPVTVTPKPETPVTVTKPEPAKVQTIFSTAASGTYYFVVHVADASVSLSSSRFGIGQFNRGNYAGSNLRHQITEFDNDQLIFVGNFGTLDDVKEYSSGITPQLRQIMKVPANLYDSFIISKENFEKLTSRDLMNKYLEFYKNNN